MQLPKKVLSSVASSTKPAPIFVVGSPRSGTTMMAAFLASEDSIINLQEFGAIYFTTYTAEREYRLVPTQHVARIAKVLQTSAANLAREIATEQGAKFFVESTPWNLRIIPTLIRHYPDAYFILMLRHYRGVIQSMERSFDLGYKWAGPDDQNRAHLWASLYTSSLELPLERTIAISYDRLCSDTEATLHSFKKSIARIGIPTYRLNEDPLMHSHATFSQRPVICSRNKDRKPNFHGRSSYDASLWSHQREEKVSSLCRPVWKKLSLHYRACLPIEAHDSC